MGWVGYVAAWIAAALFWALASASGAGRSPLVTLPYGVLAMSAAGVMGVGVWRLTGRLSWDRDRVRFVAVHALALIAFATVYATSLYWPDLVSGRAAQALAQLRRSP